MLKSVDESLAGMVMKGRSVWRKSRKPFSGGPEKAKK
jgi:hypothetical protein